MFDRSAYSNTTIRLRPAYDQTWNRNWGDFYGANGEVVVTIVTLRDHLEDEYISQVHDEESDSAEIEVRTVGVHLTDTHYEDDGKVDESYLIVAGEEEITPSVMREYLDELEEQFDRQFELTDDTFDGIPYLSQE